MAPSKACHVLLDLVVLFISLGRIREGGTLFVESSVH